MDWRVRNDCSTGKFGPRWRRRLPASEFRPRPRQPVAPDSPFESGPWSDRPQLRRLALGSRRRKFVVNTCRSSCSVVRRSSRPTACEEPTCSVSVESIASTCSRLWPTASVFALSWSKSHCEKAASIVASLGGSSSGTGGISPVAIPRSRSEKRPKPRTATIGASRNDRMVVA